MSAEVRNHACKSHPIGFDFCDMDMDLDISRWVLEFLVRRVMDDSLMEQVLSSLLLLLPVNSERLRKTMFLRAIGSKISNGSVSEKILDWLEKIAEVDRGQGFEAMKSAYCKVAVDCTVRFMEVSGNSVGQYFEAVKRIWRGRIENLDKSDGVNLISDELRSWRDVIEAAVLDDEVCKKILPRNTRNEALKSVKFYVSEEWKVMGPTFLEVVAKEMGASLMEAQKLGEHVRSNHQVEERPASLLIVQRSLGVSNEPNMRDKDRAGERALSSPNVQEDLGFSDERTMEDETQVGDRGRTSSKAVGGSTKSAELIENEVGHIAHPRPNVGGDLGVPNNFAKKDKCQLKARASLKSNARYELGATSRRPSMKDTDQCGDGTSSAHNDLGGSAKSTNTDEIHVQEIAIPLPNINGDSNDIQAKRNNYLVQERASTSFIASLDLGIANRPTMKDIDQYREEVTPCPPHPCGSTEPAITDGNRVEDIVIALLNDGVDLGVRDECTKSDKDQIEKSAATLSSESQDLGVRENHIDQRGEVAATYCEDRAGSTKSAMPVDEERAVTLSDPALRDKEFENENVLAKRKHVAGHGKRSGRGIRITDVEELSVETSSNKFDCLPIPEVNKVQEALRSSSLELQAVVKDPLPEALSLANAVLTDMGRKHMNYEPFVETQDRMDVDVPNHPVAGCVEVVQADENDVPHLSSQQQNNDPRPILTEETHNSLDANAPNSFFNKSSGAVQGHEDNPGNQFPSHQNNEARNSTARTYEWKHSIDGSPEGASRLHLQNPKRRAVPPLKKYEPTQVARKRKRWSSEEAETLRNAVQKLGTGNWKLICTSYHDIFKERTRENLKDKWRNMMK